MRKHVQAAALVALAAAAAGCGATNGTSGRTNVVVDPAAAFAVRVDADLTNGRFARAWRSLHPAQQRFLSAGALRACWRQTGQPNLERGLRFEAREARDARWPIAGVREPPRASKAVTIRVLDGKTRKVLDTFTQHVFPVAGRWRWVVNPKIVRAFRAGRCGAAA